MRCASPSFPAVKASRVSFFRSNATVQVQYCARYSPTGARRHGCAMTWLPYPGKPTLPECFCLCLACLWPASSSPPWVPTGGGTPTWGTPRWYRGRGRCPCWAICPKSCPTRTTFCPCSCHGPARTLFAQPVLGGRRGAVRESWLVHMLICMVLFCRSA